MGDVARTIGVKFTKTKQYEYEECLTTSQVHIPAEISGAASSLDFALALSENALTDLHELMYEGDESLSDVLLRHSNGFIKLSEGKDLEGFHKIFGMEDEGRIRRTTDGRHPFPDATKYASLHLRIGFALVPKGVLHA
jgi:hypothetical protein